MTIGPSRSCSDAFRQSAAPARCSAPTAMWATRCRSAASSPTAASFRLQASDTTSRAATWRRRPMSARQTSTTGQRLADEIQRRISFGIGRANNDPIGDHPVFDRIAASPVREQRGLLQLARQQLGTVGSGNHYVDLLEDERDTSGSASTSAREGSATAPRPASCASRRAARWDDGRAEGGMDAPPLLLALDAPSGQDYFEAMTIAGEYAYAGREAVVERVRAILGASVTDSVHNHHNFAWRETHDGERARRRAEGRDAGISGPARVRRRQHGRRRPSSSRESSHRRRARRCIPRCTAPGA